MGWVPPTVTMLLLPWHGPDRFSYADGIITQGRTDDTRYRQPSPSGLHSGDRLSPRPHIPTSADPHIAYIAHDSLCPIPYGVHFGHRPYHMTHRLRIDSPFTPH